jgi:DNA polymerase-3 subunit chi
MTLSHEENASKPLMEIWFYHLQQQTLDRALPALLEKTLDRGWRAVIQARSEERLAVLDQWLWTYADASFLAHGRGSDGDADLQPVYLTQGPENPNGAQIRFFIEGASMTEVLALPESQTYTRAILIFDGNSEDELQAARAQWKALKDLGFALTYWQQTEAGRWEKKI